MLGEMTFASPEATSSTPYMPTNCHRDHGSTPPRAVAVTITPTRFTNESKKTRARPRNARPVPGDERAAELRASTVTRFPKSSESNRLRLG
jgi:hypothetical protein